MLDQVRLRLAPLSQAAPIAVTSERGMLSLSFDDFPIDAWTEGGRVMADHGVHATYYVSGSLCGQVHDDMPQFEVSHLQAVAEAGHEIGCHTFDHTSALKVSAGEFHASIDRNAQWVSERLDGYVMETFAYPFGDWSIGTKRSVAKRFKCARGVLYGLNEGTVDRAGLVSIGLESKSLADFDMEAVAAKAAAQGAWLVLYGHDVGDRPSPYGCSPKQLERMILAAKAAGLDILPVKDALARIH